MSTTCVSRRVTQDAGIAGTDPPPVRRAGTIAAGPFATTARRAVAALTAHHRVAHVHGNNHRPWAVVGGIPLPSVLEVTLLRVDGRTHAPSDELFPTPLDLPCDPARVDLALGAFAFA